MPSNRLVERYTTFAVLRPMFAPQSLNWLTQAENEELGRLRDEKRRTAWLCGRWLGKQLVLEGLSRDNRDARSIEICSRNELNQSVRPELSDRGNALPWSLSISHSNRGVLASLCMSPGVRVGVDLAVIEEIRPRFLRPWLTSQEEQTIANAGMEEAAIVWSIKEAVYKACNQGESFSPQKIEVARDESGQLTACYGDRVLTENGGIKTWLIDGQVAARVTVTRDQNGMSRNKVRIPRSSTR